MSACVRLHSLLSTVTSLSYGPPLVSHPNRPRRHVSFSHAILHISTKRSHVSTHLSDPNSRLREGRSPAVGDKYVNRLFFMSTSVT